MIDSYEIIYNDGSELVTANCFKGEKDAIAFAHAMGAKSLIAIEVNLFGQMKKRKLF